jgi:hypothetical protein
MSYSKEYKVWRRIKDFCYNKKVPRYKKYGAKGITMCDQWKESFVDFFEDMGNIPDGCTGLSRIDESLEFCKINCRWVKNSIGRPSLNKVPKNKSNWGKFKNPKSICLVIEKDHIDFIKNQALQLSLQTGVYVEPNDLIRDALKKAFPCPKQMDMFGGSIK